MRVDVVQITDRHGEIIDEIPMTATTPVLDLAWDKDGDSLAVLQEGNGVIPLWSLANRRVVPLDTGLKDPTFIAWSKSGPQLAIGTAKGNLMIYHRIKKQKTSVVGKHARRITCGEWSRVGNKLVMASDDKTITISNEIGDTLLHSEIKDYPLEVVYSPRMGKSPGTDRKQEEIVVSSVVGGKSLLLLNTVDEAEDPIELCFNNDSSTSRYGDIIKHAWIDESSLLVGFGSGKLAVVSVSPNDIGTEKFTTKPDKTGLITFAYNPLLGKIAVATSSGIRMFESADLTECDGVTANEVESGTITDLQWSPDGQILSVATSAGNIYNFLVKMATLSGTYGGAVCYLSSLREISVVDCSRRSRPIDVPLKLEPTVIALGSRHVAAGMNNRVFYHRIGSGGTVVNDQEYVGSVKEIKLNHSFAAVFADGKIMIHPIEPTSQIHMQQQSRTFPTGRDEMTFGRITSMALTENFLFYGTETGTLEVFYLAELTVLSAAEVRMERGIAKLFPNAAGTRVVIIDSGNQVYLYNPVTGGGSPDQSLIKFEAAPSTIVTVMWDSVEKDVIIISDGKYLYTYIYISSSMNGAGLTKLGPIEISGDGEISVEPERIEFPSGKVPLVSINGSISCQAPDGSMSTFHHPYFDRLNGTDGGGWGDEPAPRGGSRNRRGGGDPNVLKPEFCQCIALLKLEAAWKVALQLDKRAYWFALSNKAMEMLNIELAIRVYRQLGDAAMVQALMDLVHIEDKNLLAGHVLLLFGDYGRAQELFLSSSYPQAALNMRRDLLQWEQALKLAHVIDPNQVPEVSVKYALQLEMREDYANALHTFEQAMHVQDNDGQNLCPETLITTCMAGVARCNLRLGNLRQGVRLVQDLGDSQLYIECGHILEQQKQYSEAATMHLKADNFERAAEIFTNYLIISDKTRIPEASGILEKVKNMQLNSKFAKVCASCGKYGEAAAAYKRAQDWDKVVELYLRHLEQVQDAFDLVREMGSAQGALLVAEYCQEVHDYRGAIEFLLMANKSDDAFKLAQSQGQVDSYANVLGEHIGAEDALKVAHFYEKAQDFGKAGKYYAMCGQYSRALKFFLQCGDREIDAAIDVVAKSQNDNLTHQLLDFLMGEKDGIPKDQNYQYRLWMARKRYDEAVKSALVIVRSEQELGNYPASHAVVYETVRRLEDDDVRVPMKLRSTFVLLHSYVLAKTLVRMGDSTGAARMLLRVAQNISTFPKDVVRILTSTVVLCQKAGLKASSYEYAKALMHPEHRATIDDNFKRKIEAIVRRKSSNADDVPEELSMCPISHQMIPTTLLECPTTRDAIPMCIITGRHMLLDDWCFCPRSKFPATLSEYIKYIDMMNRSQDDKDESQGGAVDPILGQPVDLSELVKCTQEEVICIYFKIEIIFGLCPYLIFCSAGYGLHSKV